jgi:DNA-binding FadR family transcriptional regulator
LGLWPTHRAFSTSQLAAIANVSRSVLSPILQALAAKGTIELGHRTITIAEPVALRRVR